MDIQRKAFEAWVTSTGRSIECFSNGSYKSMTLDKEWNAWKAVSEIQQDKIDNLILEAADMKSRLNDNYTAGQTSMYLTKQAEIDDLKAQLLLVQADTKRIDFLADTSQNVANVMLPTKIVERNVSSLRDAIDEAMFLAEHSGV